MSSRISAARASATIAAIVCGALGSGCSPLAAGRGSHSATPAENECVTTGSPPAELRVLPVQYPTSQLTIIGQLSERWLNAQLDEHLPIIVAEEKERPIGVAGRASYRIKRGSLSIEQRAGVLFATLPLAFDISVCKPFGSGCFQYGSCTPRLDIEMLWDGDLSANYELKGPNLAAITRERCRIGIDVTPQIESTARSELAKIQRRLDRTFSQVDESVATWAIESHPPLGVWPEQCVSWSVTGVRQRPLRVENLDKDTDPPGKHLTVGLQATGQLAVFECQGTLPTSPGHSLPAPRITQTLPSASQVQVPERVSVESLRTALHEQLDAALGSHRLRQVQLASDGVYLELELGGAECGLAWFKAQLRVVGGDLRLHQPLALSPSRAARKQLLSQLSATLSERFSLPLLGSPWIKGEGKRWLKDLIAPAQAQLTQQDLNIAVTKFQAKSASVQVATDGIYVFQAASFQLRLSAAQRRNERSSSLEVGSD